MAVTVAKLKLAPGDDAEEADRWRIWSREGIVISDPTTIPNRLERVPEGLEPQLALSGYDTQRSTGRKVSCAACGHSRNHYHGFLVEFVDSSIALVGIECGERYFGRGAWNALVARHEHAKRVALYSARSAPAIAKLAQILPLVAAWAESLAPFDDFLDELWTELPSLMGDLKVAAKSGATMTREVAVKVQKQDAQGRAVERTEWQLRRFGSLPAAELLIGNTLTASLSEAQRLLQQAAAALEREEPTLTAQQAAFGLINKARGLLQGASQNHERASDLLNPELWTTVCKWANADPLRQGNYRFKRGKLKQSDASYDYGSVVVPAKIELPPSPWKEITSLWPHL